MVLYGYQIIPMVIRRARQNKSVQCGIYALIEILRDCRASTVNGRKQSIGYETSVRSFSNRKEWEESVKDVSRVRNSVCARHREDNKYSQKSVERAWPL